MVLYDTGGGFNCFQEVATMLAFLRCTEVEVGQPSTSVIHHESVANAISCHNNCKEFQMVC